MQLTRLCPVTLVHKHINIAFGFKVRRNAAAEFLQVFCYIFIGGFFALVFAAKLVNERTHQPGRSVVELLQ
ncbi:MAG: hypothetical protein BWX49_00897 [Bacteroidetes bacterium ADurb.Bin008]|nr:MAG: hypothetical protein BWX49_00897 [Bacteroidetes bacterium ADurb.Bin008]